MRLRDCGLHFADSADAHIMCFTLVYRAEIELDCVHLS